MADFCKQCSLAILGEDTRDLANLGEPVHGDATVWSALCEGCGPTYVNIEGQCVTDCLEHHGWRCPGCGNPRGKHTVECPLL